MSRRLANLLLNEFARNEFARSQPRRRYGSFSPAWMSEGNGSDVATRETDVGKFVIAQARQFLISPPRGGGLLDDRQEGGCY